MLDMEDMAPSDDMENGGGDTGDTPPELDRDSGNMEL